MEFVCRIENMKVKVFYTITGDFVVDEADMMEENPLTFKQMEEAIREDPFAGECDPRIDGKVELRIEQLPE